MSAVREQAAPDPVQATRATLSYLRRARAGHHAQQRSDAAYRVYLVALTLGVYVFPYAQVALNGGFGLPSSVRAETARLLATALLGAVAVAVVLLTRATRWTGPVRLGLPDLDWVMSAPVDRGLLLRRAARQALVTAVVVGGASALVLGGLAQAFVQHRLDGWLAVVVAIGAALALALVGLALAVQTAARPDRASRVVAAPAWLLLVLAAVALWAGWAVPGGYRVVAPAVLVVLAVGGAALLSLGAARVGRLSTARLTRSATTSQRMSSALSMADLRQVSVAGSEAVDARPLRWPVPRRAWQLAPWRVALVWRRRLAPSAVWLLAAVAAGVLAPQLSVGTGGQRALLALVEVGLVYLALGRAAEAVRLEADDPHRADHLPYRFADWVSRLGATVTGAVWAVVGVSAALSWSAGDGAAGRGAIFLLLVPAVAGAVTASACKGSVPIEMLIPVMTPMGSTGPFRVVFWYLRGPLLALLAAAPMVLWASVSPASLPPGGVVAGLVGISPGTAAAWCVLSAALLWTWARNRARKLLTG